VFLAFYRVGGTRKWIIKQLENLEWEWMGYGTMIFIKYQQYKESYLQAIWEILESQEAQPAAVNMVSLLQEEHVNKYSICTKFVVMVL
jgi:hypothetical protein